MIVTTTATSRAAASPALPGHRRRRGGHRHQRLYATSSPASATSSAAARGPTRRSCARPRTAHRGDDRRGEGPRRRRGGRRRPRLRALGTGDRSMLMVTANGTAVKLGVGAVWPWLDPQTGPLSGMCRESRAKPMTAPNGYTRHSAESMGRPSCLTSVAGGSGKVSRQTFAAVGPVAPSAWRSRRRRPARAGRSCSRHGPTVEVDQGALLRSG